MSFSHFFRFISIVLAISVANSFAAKTNFGKFRSVIGEVEHKTIKSDEWKKARPTVKVYEGDMIRTMIESQATIGLPDGSAISIEENSIVSISELLSEDGKNVSTTDIKSGKVRFDVQKQANKESSFKFKTGTAVAAIRGTEGIIGTSSNGKFIASLLTGRLEIDFGGSTTTINGGQTAIPSGEALTVLDLSSSGTTDLFNVIDQILNDTTLTIDSLTKLITEKNLDLEKAKDLIKENLKCEFTPLPDKVADTVVTIKGKCAASDTVEIAGQKQESKGNDMEFTPSWEADAIGEKKFAVTCQVGALHIPCGQLKTYFTGLPKEEKVDSTQVEPLLTVTTPSPISVSASAAATIEGSFTTKDSSATLFIKMGNYVSPNLVQFSANGQFSHTINISEKKKNWNEKNVVIEYKSSKLGSKSISLDLDIDKSSKFVNTVKPVLSIKSRDSLKCYVKLALDNIDGDEVIYNYSIDGSTSNISARYTKDATIKQNLLNGIHDYTFLAEDMAGNSTKITKTLGCFPTRKHTLEIEGGNSYERIRAPRPPQGYSSNSIYKNLTFKVTNIPDNDPRYIKMITISQKGKTIVLRPTDFQSNIFDQQIELQHNAKTNVTIKVIMKNGTILSATKTYEVR